VTINYQCELDELPRTISELLGNLEQNDLVFVAAEIEKARSHSFDKNVSEALESIDRVRVDLAKIDLRLMEYANILAGYTKADADLKTGASLEKQPESEMPKESLDTKDISDDQISRSSDSE